MRTPRLLTYALVRDPRLPHLLRSLLGDLWRRTPNVRRRLVIAGCYEELCDVERGDAVEAVLVEIRDGNDVLRLAGAQDSAPDARVIAVPSSLLLTPLVAATDANAQLAGQCATVLESLDEDGLIAALGEAGLGRTG